MAEQWPASVVPKHFFCQLSDDRLPNFLGGNNAFLKGIEKNLCAEEIARDLQDTVLLLRQLVSVSLTKS